MGTLSQKRMKSTGRHWAGKFSKLIGLDHSHMEESIFPKAHWPVFSPCEGFKRIPFSGIDTPQ